MAESIVFSAEARDKVGKGAARATRRNGRIPAVIYGAGKAPSAISLNPAELQMHLDRPGFFATLFDIEVGGAKQQVLCRALQVQIGRAACRERGCPYV